MIVYITEGEFNYPNDGGKRLKHELLYFLDSMNENVVVFIQEDNDILVKLFNNIRFIKYKKNNNNIFDLFIKYFNIGYKTDLLEKIAKSNIDESSKIYLHLSLFTPQTNAVINYFSKKNIYVEYLVVDSRISYNLKRKWFYLPFTSLQNFLYKKYLSKNVIKCYYLVSNIDMQIDVNYGVKNIQKCLPITFNVGSYRTNKVNDKILFVGAFDYKPNQEAIYFIKKLLNNEKMSNFKFVIAGKDIDFAVQVLKGYSNVEFFDYVEDINDLYKNAKLSINPIFSGAGVKNKIVEALLTNTIVVSTEVGVEGINLANNVHYLRATTIDDFVNMICILYSSNDLCANIAKNARMFALKNYSRENLEKLFYDK